jgi:hypothetical protein
MRLATQNAIQTGGGKTHEGLGMSTRSMHANWGLVTSVVEHIEPRLGEDVPELSLFRVRGSSARRMRGSDPPNGQIVQCLSVTRSLAEARVAICSFWTVVVATVVSVRPCVFKGDSERHTK